MFSPCRDLVINLSPIHSDLLPACSSPLMLDFRVSSYLQCKKPSNCCSSFSVLTESIQAEVIKQSCPWCPGLFICSCLLTYWSKNARGPVQTDENTQENGQEAYCLEAWRWGMQAAWFWRATKRQSLHVIGWAHWRHRTCRHRSFRTRAGNWCQRWNHFGNLRGTMIPSGGHQQRQKPSEGWLVARDEIESKQEASNRNWKHESLFIHH